MSMKYFSVMYDALTQRRFEEALDDGDLEKAVTVLNGLPSGHDLYENVERVRVMIEGYKAIISNLDRLSLDERGELEEYRGLGELEVLKEIKEDYDELKQVMEDMDIDLAEDLEKDLKELEMYRDIGDLEYLTKLEGAKRSLEAL